MGLREQKKKRTRKAISDMATLLFIERGYHQVTTAEIAEKAGVSVPTLFNYFPTKEAMVFDEDRAIEAGLIDTVVKRRPGQSIVEALIETGFSGIDVDHAEHQQQVASFMALVDNTPELSRYAKDMWLRHEASLASAILASSPAPISPLQAQVIAHYILDAFQRAIRTQDPNGTLKALLTLLADGWRG
ncbi:MAG: TetR/AcrR family transcriptional regulator [Pseudomonadota bacterium]|uniref:TetR/AcrR family transcriptional regulator n=1 Tax=Gallaecimonas pentaromativorans TaxID=584787 RepID=UPI000B02E18D|nr:TetR/AcrR family transcriptional regulator [Gallaecimonas pentaromativorans]MED5523485.1 TetR/AcrR family transcriptional regulator [Pseudomonadota bacterium]